MRWRWKKLGLIYSLPEGGLHEKLLSHAANPLPIWREGDVFRIYFNARDAQKRSSIGVVDIDIVRRQLVQEHHAPVFENGPKGSFYEDGVSIGNCCTINGKDYMFFMGWQVPPSGQFRGDMGRLQLHADGTLSLENDVPFMAADAVDPISISYPWVRVQEEGGYSMWYGSTHTWDAGNGEMIHVLHKATSQDGDHWQRLGLSVPYELGTAQAFSRPTVRRDASGLYEMWFSYRGAGQKYRIGYATSADGEQWSLKLDETGIAPSPDGWDSEMIEYPYVFDHKGETYMLYNGNSYGITGFGLAVREVQPSA